jgi:Leucine-rich repeat (LRR) protein
MEKSNKNKKKKNNSKNNSSHSSGNNSNISDENKNSLNNSGSITKEKNTNTNNNINIESSNQEQNQKHPASSDAAKEKLNQLKNLKYIFPFLNEEHLTSKDEGNKMKNYSISEYNNIVSSINKNKSPLNKNKYEEDILEGKVNIIDKVIQKHMPASNDSKVISIHPGLTALSLKIDKNFNMMNDIGYRLPNLIELNLQGSEIESIMDIGTSFNKLEKLNVSGCGLTDLSGIICFQNLKELNASNNKITDLIDIEMCEELKVIDLSNNLITNENNLLFLNSCPNLQKVILTGNKLGSFNRDLLDKNIQIII